MSIRRTTNHFRLLEEKKTVYFANNKPFFVCVCVSLNLLFALVSYARSAAKARRRMLRRCVGHRIKPSKQTQQNSHFQRSRSSLCVFVCDFNYLILLSDCAIISDLYMI